MKFVEIFIKDKINKVDIDGIPMMYIESIQLKLDDWGYQTRLDYRELNNIPKDILLREAKEEASIELTKYIMENLHIRVDDNIRGPGQIITFSYKLCEDSEKDIYDKRIEQLKSRLKSCVTIIGKYQDESAMDMIKRWWKKII